MDLSLQENLAPRNAAKLLFQPVFLGGDESYLVYLAPEEKTDGHFRQEEGGVVWCSTIHPEGICCESQIIPKALGDIILGKTNQTPEQRVRRIEIY